MTGFIIQKIDFGSDTFQKTFRKLDSQVQKEAKKTLSELILLDISKAPAKPHLHTLKDKEVRSATDPKQKCAVYTLHLTSNDRFKASFTFEGGTAYFRVCGEHDWIDGNP